MRPPTHQRPPAPTRLVWQYPTRRTALCALAAALLMPLALPQQAHALSVQCQHDLTQSQTCGKRIVEVMFVLDTTGSMSGLIAGAKQKIWSIANEIADNDPNAIVRMGLIGYRDRGDRYVTQFHDLTEDVDDLYGKLLAFQANGGGDTPESVNQAIYEAVTRATWTSAPQSQTGRNIRLVFLAGDAPPHMDYQQDIQYPQSMQIARDRGIKVNTLQAGRMAKTQKVWIEIARLGDGVYAQIPQSGNVQVIKTPYDQRIYKLQQQLESTVIPYGVQRTRDSYRSKLNTRKSASAASVADRASYYTKQKGKREVVTGGADLLAELEAGNVKLDALEAKKLPKALQGISVAERKSLVAKRQRQRTEIDGRLSKLVKQRETYLNAKRAEAPRDDAFDLVIRKSIKNAF